MDYYDKSILYIYKRIKNPVFIFFSDDLEWCKENFN
ncbi:alpha-1,2-fucosyltransferase [bacterium]|nr:alpha-1,2-fucosyltransferase [bacterium]